MDTDFLLRGDAPFGSDLWERIDQQVVRVARDQLVGRRFLPIYGPLGAGIQGIPLDKLNFDEETCTDLLGDQEPVQAKAQNRTLAAVPMLYKDFLISWRDVETEKQTGVPVDLSAAAAAANALSKKEDDMIFNGCPEFGYPGLLNAEGRQKVSRSNWSEGDNPFLDVAAGVEKLTSEGIFEPYTLIVGTDLYLQMQRLQEGTGVLLIDRIRELVGGKVYQSPVIGKGKAVLVACSSHYMDLAIGQDIITGYIGPEKMNHTFRVFETALFRLKRDKAVVTFE